MKMVAEYLEHTLAFERMAADEVNPDAKAQLEQQAAAYRKLATDRAKAPGMGSNSYSVAKLVSASIKLPS